MKSGTVFHQRLFRIYMSLFQVGYNLHYRQLVVQLCINQEMFIFHICSHYFVHPLYVCRYTYSSTIRMDREPDSIAEMYETVYVCGALLHIYIYIYIYMCEVLKCFVKRIPRRTWVECCNYLQLG